MFFNQANIEIYFFFTPIAESIAGYFGGGGHPQAAGFRTYDTTYEDVVRELIKIIPGLLLDA